LNSFDLNSNDPYKLIGQLCTKKRNEEPPSLGSIILTLEWLMPGFQQSDIPAVVSDYFSHIADTNAPWDDLLRYSRLIDMIRQEAGVGLFNEIYASLLSGNQSIASSLAPTPRFMSKQCTKCGTFRLFHTFCHYCSNLFDVKKDCLKAVKAFVEIQSEVKSAYAKKDSTKCLNETESVIRAGNAGLKYFFWKYNI